MARLQDVRKVKPNLRGGRDFDCYGVCYLHAAVLLDDAHVRDEGADTGDERLFVLQNRVVSARVTKTSH